MTSTLLIVQIILSIAITISVLLQKSSSIGLGAYSGSNESMFGAKGPMGFLAKITFTLAILFVLNTLALGYLYTQDNNKSVVDTVPSVVPTSPEKVASEAPVAPAAPATEASETTPVAPSVIKDKPKALEVPEVQKSSEPTLTTTDAEENATEEQATPIENVEQSSDVVAIDESSQESNETTSSLEDENSRDTTTQQ